MRRTLDLVLTIAALTVTPAAAGNSPQKGTLEDFVGTLPFGKLITKNRTIAVMSLEGPKGKLTELGRHIADELVAELQRRQLNLTVLGPAELQPVLDKEKLSPQAIFHPTVARWVARLSDAHAVFLGEWKVDGDTVQVAVSIWDTAKEQKISSGEFRIQRHPEHDALIQAGAPELEAIPAPKAHRFPTCVYCPNPRFTGEAEKKKVKGVAVLRVVVTRDGRAEQIHLVKAAGYGLDESAIRAVQEWRFQPATNRVGQPIATFVLIEVSFKQF